MASIYLKSGNATVWAASTVYAAGAKVVSLAATNYWVYSTAAGGTSGGTEPTWNNVDGGANPTDGTVTWTTRAPFSWTYATITLLRAVTGNAAGDYFYVSSSHSESTAATQTYTFAGTITNPSYVLSVDDTSGTPPTTLLAGGTVVTTGAFSIVLQGSVYCYGMTFSAMTGNVSGSITFVNIAGPATQTYESCKFRIGSTTTGSFAFIVVGTSINQGNRTVTWNNCSVKFGAAGSQYVGAAAGVLYWNGGSIESGSASPTGGLFRTDSLVAGQIYVNGIDFSNLNSAIYLTSPVAAMYGVLSLRDCKMPSGWANTVVNATVNGPYHPVGVYNSSGTSLNYNTVYQGYFGKVVPETTYVRTGGASDGTTPLSWNMTSTSSAAYPQSVLTSNEIVVWNNVTGISKTATVEILHDSATALTDAEIWVEVMYLGSSATPLGTIINDSKANVFATAANQPVSADAWTTTGMANPNKQKLSVTFTPQMKGYVHARVMLAKASKTVYVDPVLTIA
jgi:hypothetical protein